MFHRAVIRMDIAHSAIQYSRSSVSVHALDVGCAKVYCIFMNVSFNVNSKFGIDLTAALLLGIL